MIAMTSNEQPPAPETNTLANPADTTSDQDDLQVPPDLDEIVRHADGTPMFWDRERKPLTLREFGQLFQDHSYRILARTDIGDATVTTAWLGVDQGPLGEDLPQIFGTIIRRGDQWGTERFDATEADALTRHADVVAALEADGPITGTLR